MKFIALAALLGYTQAGIRLTRVDGSITNIPESAALIHLESDKIEEKDGKVTYSPSYDKFDGNKGTFGDWREPYERVIPERFEGDTGDTFTKKMIKEYAIETADKDTGLPTGKFIIPKAQAKVAAVEVLGTHLGLHGAEADAHLARYFDEVWQHFDVLSAGALEAVEMNHFMRDLCKPVKEFIYLEVSFSSGSAG